ncbi:hypothetical protein BDY21DRAFT_372650 [Lineolata rhizophorae]|uniref:Phospholipid/glycerol acyltransferase domain-containing protein n=1 Tax=Lineolata rhizophorae TaxID=578093 RepID=A0A6A6NYG5_9PEZI|nr:hypothetical protein BDY21DRAFT_372650 [Lineolata rhizophorae]
MEKYSQFRDRGSGIAPFFPVPTQPSGLRLPLHVFLFCVRVPLVFAGLLFYVLVLTWLPIGNLLKKATLWFVLGVPGIWWVDLQLDGVRRGSLSRQPAHRLPSAGTIIASSFTSPLDALYLTAIFDPLLTASYPSTPQIEVLSLPRALLRALSPPLLAPPPGTKLTDLAALLRAHPDRAVVVFPECTTTNGRAILPFSPSLTRAPPGVKIFPVSLRYSPPDITTPVPATYADFLWNLCSKPTHCIRVRIAAAVLNDAAGASAGAGVDWAAAPTATGTPRPAASPKQRPVAGSPSQPQKNSYVTNYFDSLGLGFGAAATAASTATTTTTAQKHSITSTGLAAAAAAGPESERLSSADTLIGSEDGGAGGGGAAGEDSAALPPPESQKVLDRVAEDLARLGRVKRVALGVRDKIEFVRRWRRGK